MLARNISSDVLTVYQGLLFFEKKVDEDFLISVEYEGEIPDELIKFLNSLEEHIFYNINRYFDTSRGYDYSLLRYKLVCYALKMVSLTQPELVYFLATPHDPVSYILYQVSKFKKLNVLLFNLAGSVQAYYLYREIGNQARYVINAPKKTSPDLIEESLSHMLARIEEFRGEDPWFMKIQKKRYGSIAKKAYHSLIVRKNASVKGFKRYRFKKHQRDIYQSLSEIRSVADINSLNAPFVFFPMHYQPELTTSPDGGDFSQQWLVVKRISELVQKTGAFILVKEHPSQFLVNSKVVRTDILYKALLKVSDRVKLVSLEVPSRNLLQKASSVATITGTIALEAIVASKPVLAFGDAKVLGIKGVYDIRIASEVNEFLVYHKGEKELNFETIKIDLLSLSASEYYYPYFKEKKREEQELKALSYLLFVYLKHQIIE